MLDRCDPTDHLSTAYVLDLRDRFPCPGGDAQLAAAWRGRALELETRCSKLERMFDWDKLGTDPNRKSREQAGGKDFHRASGRDKCGRARDAR